MLEMFAEVLILVFLCSIVVLIGLLIWAVSRWIAEQAKEKSQDEQAKILSDLVKASDSDGPPEVL